MRYDTSPRDYGVLFSTAMVMALLAGTKTQTRRVVTKHTSETSVPFARIDLTGDNPMRQVPYADGIATRYLHAATRPPPSEPQNDPNFWTTYRVLPRVRAGDRLHVKETWQQDARGKLIYLADFHSAPGAEAHRVKWLPSLLMPKRVARIWLQVARVRVERLQSITPDDALAEGVTVSPYAIGAIDRYRELWDYLNGHRELGWNANPWVWVYEFERVASAPAATVPESKRDTKGGSGCSPPGAGRPGTAIAQG